MNFLDDLSELLGGGPSSSASNLENSQSHGGVMNGSSSTTPLNRGSSLTGNTNASSLASGRKDSSSHSSGANQSSSHVHRLSFGSSGRSRNSLGRPSLSTPVEPATFNFIEPLAKLTDKPLAPIMPLKKPKLGVLKNQNWDSPSTSLFKHLPSVSSSASGLVNSPRNSKAGGFPIPPPRSSIGFRPSSLGRASSFSSLDISSTSARDTSRDVVDGVSASSPLHPLEVHKNQSSSSSTVPSKSLSNLIDTTHSDVPSTRADLYSANGRKIPKAPALTSKTSKASSSSSSSDSSSEESDEEVKEEGSSSDSSSSSSSSEEKPSVIGLGSKLAQKRSLSSSDSSSDTSSESESSEVVTTSVPSVILKESIVSSIKSTSTSESDSESSSTSDSGSESSSSSSLDSQPTRINSKSSADFAPSRGSVSGDKTRKVIKSVSNSESDSDSDSESEETVIPSSVTTKPVIQDSVTPQSSSSTSDSETESDSSSESDSEASSESDSLSSSSRSEGPPTKRPHVAVQPSVVSKDPLSASDSSSDSSSESESSSVSSVSDSESDSEATVAVRAASPDSTMSASTSTSASSRASSSTLSNTTSNSSHSSTTISTTFSGTVRLAPSRYSGSRAPAPPPNAGVAVPLPVSAPVAIPIPLRKSGPLVSSAAGAGGKLGDVTASAPSSPSRTVPAVHAGSTSTPGSSSTPRSSSQSKFTSENNSELKGGSTLQSKSNSKEIGGTPQSNKFHTTPSQLARLIAAFRTDWTWTNAHQRMIIKMNAPGVIPEGWNAATAAAAANSAETSQQGKAWTLSDPVSAPAEAHPKEIAFLKELTAQDPSLLTKKQRNILRLHCPEVLAATAVSTPVQPTTPPVSADAVLPSEKKSRKPKGTPKAEQIPHSTTSTTLSKETRATLVATAEGLADPELVFSPPPPAKRFKASTPAPESSSVEGSTKNDRPPAMAVPVQPVGQRPEQDIDMHSPVTNSVAVTMARKAAKKTAKSKK